MGSDSCGSCTDCCGPDEKKDTCPTCGNNPCTCKPEEPKPEETTPEVPKSE